MKKSILYILMIFLASVGCKEVGPMMYGDLTGVYFNNLGSNYAVSDTADLTFVYTKGDEMEVPVKIQLLGHVSDKDRTIKMSVTSDNAREGIDYQLNGLPMIESGERQGEYVITLKRTPELKKQKKQITLTLEENENFKLPIKDNTQSGKKVSTIVYNIFFSDMFTKAPLAWEENLLGKFSLGKFELICKYLDLDPADFNNAEKMTLSMMLYINNEMTAYISEQVSLMNAGQPYDKDIIDLETGLPYVFS